MVSKETIYNVFIYFNNGIAKTYGVKTYGVDLDDNAKAAFLRERVDKDHKSARRYDLSRAFTPDEWLSVLRAGRAIDYFEEAFCDLQASHAPYYCHTPIVDGEPRIEKQIGAGPFRGSMVSELTGCGSVPDYLINYVDETGFHLAKLINDDYFAAIKILFNGGFYISSAKLLMSCIDTLAFVEHGDQRGNFKNWLSSYVDLNSHGITPEELWEFRNSILHMTNLTSRKVIRGQVSSIMLYVSGRNVIPGKPADIHKPVNLHRLILSIAAGIAQWADSYNSNPEKILKFIERYDTTVSDIRVARVELKNGTEREDPSNSE